MPSAQRMTHVDDLIERRKQQVFLAIIPRLAHRTPNVDNAVRNHESPQSKILKRKKARSNTPLSCRIEYYIKTNSACFSDRSVFFTCDYRLLL